MRRCRNHVANAPLSGAPRSTWRSLVLTDGPHPPAAGSGPEMLSIRWRCWTVSSLGRSGLSPVVSRASRPGQARARAGGGRFSARCPPSRRGSGVERRGESWRPRHPGSIGRGGFGQAVWGVPGAWIGRGRQQLLGPAYGSARHRADAVDRISVWLADPRPPAFNEVLREGVVGRLPTTAARGPCSPAFDRPRLGTTHDRAEARDSATEDQKVRIWMRRRLTRIEERVPRRRGNERVVRDAWWRG